MAVKYLFDFYSIRIDLQDFGKETLNLSTGKFILTRKKENSIFLYVYIFILLALHVDVVFTDLNWIKVYNSFLGWFQFVKVHSV